VADGEPENGAIPKRAMAIRRLLRMARPFDKYRNDWYNGDKDARGV
jgi:hypothetical protein